MKQSAVVLAAVLGWASVGSAENREALRYFNSAVVHYERLDYEKALQQLQKADAKAATSEDECQVSLLTGIVLAELGKNKKALAAFSAGFGIELEARLPLEVSPKILALAQKARAQVRQMLPAVAGRPRDSKGPGLASAKICADADEELQRIWDPELRATVLRQLEHSKRPEVAAVASGLVKQLDGWADSWSDHRLATCLRDKVRHELSSGAVAAREACLGDGAAAFDALVKMLASGAEVGEGVLKVTSRLPEPGDCTQQSRGSAKGLILDAETTVARGLLSRAIALLELGQRAQAEAALKTVLPFIHKSADPELKADFGYWDGVAKQQDGNTVAAIAAHQEAVARALEANYPRAAVRSLSELVALYGSVQNDFAGAQRSYRWAQRLLKREPESALAMARLKAVWGAALNAANKLNESKQILEEALASVNQSEPSSRAEREKSIIYTNMGVTLFDLDDKLKALEFFEKDTQIMIAAFGREHQGLVIGWSNLGAVHLDLGHLEIAEKLLESSIELAKKLKWPEGKASAYSNLGAIHRLTHRTQSAQRYYQNYADWTERLRGPDHPALLIEWLGLGAAMRDNGQAGKAVGFHQRAFALAEKLADLRTRAGATVELALDYVALEQWQAVPQFTESCAAATQQGLLDADQVLSCEIATNALTWETGSREEAVTAMRKVLEPRAGEEGVVALYCEHARTIAKEWLLGKGGREVAP